MKFIGEEPRADVLAELVRKNNAILEQAKKQSQGYQYGIVKNLLETEYHTLKKKLDAERDEQERRREEEQKQPRIDYSHIWRADPKPQEGIGDISELLEDFFEEDDDDSRPSSSSHSPTALQIMAEMMRQREPEMDEWDDDDDEL